MMNYYKFISMGCEKTLMGLIISVSHLLLQASGIVSHCPLVLHDTASNHCCVELITWPARH